MAHLRLGQLRVQRPARVSCPKLIYSPRPQVFVLTLRIGGVFVQPGAALTVGVFLCTATVGVAIVAFVLANKDRIDDQRLEHSHKLSEVAGDESSQEDARLEAPHADVLDLDIALVGEAPRREDKPKVVEGTAAKASQNSMPWSLFSGPLCGAEADDDEHHVATIVEVTGSDA